MKNFVLGGSSRLNKDFLDVRAPVLVRLPRVETACPKFIVHQPVPSLQYGVAPQGGVLLSHTLVHLDGVGLFGLDTLLSFIVLRTDLGFLGWLVKRRGAMTLHVLESRKNRKTSIAGVRHS
jgi:hypothetical protein